MVIDAFKNPYKCYNDDRLKYLKTILKLKSI